eukprot:2189862-Heterocapsa_arctica.AAC.1
MEAVNTMRGKPETIHADQEGAWTSQDIRGWCSEHRIRFVTMQGHAPVAERQIRTIKDMLYARTDHAKKM